MVGAYLARYPDITYDSIDTYFPGVGVLEKSGITPERFDYARRFGQIWLKSIEDDPKNKAMKDRLALFQKRFGRQDIIPLQNIRTLLRDDQAFKAFLTDDAAAIAWVNKNQDINKTQREHTFSYQSIDSMLHPITVGVLPALAS
ncbi:MAG: hypothetical protein CFE31_08170 [Rhizobiales bacterium PAR1]|nr:MAG: hypothetical protein CFE31_08170 [Rhizobiales bacterium PAR1]